MAFLPPSTNGDYRGARLAAWGLGLLGLATLVPGMIHSFLPDGGAGTIAHLDLSGRRELVLALFRWEGATQLAFGAAMLAVAIRYRPLTPFFLALFIVETTLEFLQGWVIAPPSNGFHPPEHYGSVATLGLALVFLVLALRRRRTDQDKISLEPRVPAADFDI